MNDATTRATLLAAHPQLFVDDIDAACAFFEAQLGFTTVFRHGSPPFYGQVGRDGVRLNLRCAVPSPLDRERARAAAYLCAYVMVDDVHALYDECLARSAPIHQPLRRAPWNMDEFVVQDPSGNLILFASDVPA